MKNRLFVLVLVLFPVVSLAVWVTWGLKRKPVTKPGVILESKPVQETKPAVETKPAEKTVEDRLKEFGPTARAKLKPYFDAKQVPYPPAKLTLVGLKEEKQLEVYAAGEGQKLKFIRSYPILAASGVSGPKLKQGDKQVPEGIYPIEWLNPNSSYHLSFRIGYPNEFDREHAKEDGRTDLGGDIMIHGAAKSVGCLAMGDPVSEELFVLAAETGITNITVILTPVDFRQGKSVADVSKLPKWTPGLYEMIKAKLNELPGKE